MEAKSQKNWGDAYVCFGESEKGVSMSVYEALTLMFAFASLVIRIIDKKDNKKSPSILLCLVIDGYLSFNYLVTVFLTALVGEV